MDLVASITRRIIAPAWAIWEGSPYLRHYRRILHTQYDSPGEIRRRQLDALRQLLKHAYETTHFWRTRFDEVNFQPANMQSLSDLSQIPLLTKNDLREHLDEMISDQYDRRALLCAQTSGSTGVPVTVFCDDSRRQFGRACTLRSDEWSGWRLGERIGAIWGNAAAEFRGRGWRGFLRNMLLHRIIYLDSLRIEEKSMRLFATALRRSQPPLIYGHAHSLYLFAKYLDARGQTDIRPRGIISSAMVLHDWERQLLEKVFQCPVTNRYGCEEVGLIACECEQHEGLHINADGIYLEVIRADGKPAAAGDSGMIVVTDLHNLAMPIIRYQIGDMGQLSDRVCRCGRGLPLLQRIDGRVADYVVTPSGRLVSGISLTDHFNTKVPGVIQMQIIQKKIDLFILRIVKDSDYGAASEKMINSLVRQHFGEESRYECEFVESILREPSGKFRFCISKVERPFWCV